MSETTLSPSSEQATRQIFVNLPVKDLPRTTAFFTELGFSFNPQASDEQTACMIVSDGSFVMLHAEPYFREFTGGDVADPATSREVVVGLSTTSREQVDDLVDTAVAAGGRAVGEGVDQGFMYMRAFRDLDGHQWSLLYLDMSGMQQ